MHQEHVAIRDEQAAGGMSQADVSLARGTSSTKNAASQGREVSVGRVIETIETPCRARCEWGIMSSFSFPARGIGGNYRSGPP